MNVGNMKEICMPVIICAYHCYCVVCLSFVVGLNVVSTFMPIKHFSCHISSVLSVQQGEGLPQHRSVVRFKTDL